MNRTRSQLPMTATPNRFTPTRRVGRWLGALLTAGIAPAIPGPLTALSALAPLTLAGLAALLTGLAVLSALLAGLLTGLIAARLLSAALGVLLPLLTALLTLAGLLALLLSLSLLLTLALLLTLPLLTLPLLSLLLTLALLTLLLPKAGRFFKLPPQVLHLRESLLQLAAFALASPALLRDALGLA